MANEKRLIDANELLRDARRNKPICACLADIVDIQDLVNDQPIVDAVEVVHGRWVEGGLFNDLAKCSVCGAKHFTMGFVYDNKFSYCPNCGAKMDGERSKTE